MNMASAANLRFADTLKGVGVLLQLGHKLGAHLLLEGVVLFHLFVEQPWMKIGSRLVGKKS